MEMQNLTRIALIAIVAITMVVAFAILVDAAVKCPECGHRATWTGKTRVNDAAKIMKEYKCLRGHTFWVQSGRSKK